MSNTHKEHYVPVFYLKKFSDSIGWLYAYSSDIKKTIRKKPTDFCYENDLYETRSEINDFNVREYIDFNGIENMFGKVEAKEFAPFINSIDEACVCRVDSSGHVLSSSDERILLKLIVNFLVRNPNAKDLFCHVEIPDSICTSQEYNDVCLLFKQLGLVGADSVFKAALKRNALSFDDGCLPDMLYSSLEKLPYVFYYSKEGEFITCDSPVLCSSDVSITDEDDTCIYMPLTPKVAVMLGNYKSFKNNCNTARELSNRQIRIFNEALINQSAQYRWIIASSELILKKYF